MGRPATTKKQDLLNTALELMWKHSYGSVSVDDICKAADVNKGSFYYYFKSKAALAGAALDAYYQEQKPYFDDVFSPTLPPRERLERLADGELAYQKGIVDKYGDVRGCPFTTLGTEMAGQDGNIRAKVEQIGKYYERYFESMLTDLITEGLLDKKTDTKARARQLYGFLLGQLTMARIQNSLEPLESNLKEGLLRIAGID